MENNMVSEANQENKLQNFSQKKFISDLYTCETTKYILENRISDIKKAIAEESRKIKPIDIPKFEKTAYYEQYISNKKNHENLHSGWYEPGNFARSVLHPLENRRHRRRSKDESGCLISLGCAAMFTPLACIPLAYLVLYIVVSIYTSYKKKQAEKEAETINKEIRKQNSKIDAENEELYKQYYAQYEEYVDRIKKDYADYLAQRKKEIQAITESLEHEKQIAQAELKKTEEVLEGLYNLRIDGVLCLHPDYKGLYPISIIYGYFDTGRCSCLTGHEGAYNLYADEIRYGLISRKLDNISAGLNNLNSTTYYVAQAVEKCTAQIKNMNSSMYTMIECVSDSNLENASYHDKMEKLGTSIAEENAEFYEDVTRHMDSARLHYYLERDAGIRR